MAVEAAVLVAALKSVGRAGKISAADAAAYAATATDDAATTAADAAAAAASAGSAAAASASAVASDVAYASAGDAAAAVRRSIRAADQSLSNFSLRQDYDWLATQATKDFTPQTFFERPLWFQIPSDWKGLLSQWRSALSSVELGEIYQRHERMLNGGGLDWDEAEQWLNRWVDFRRERGPIELKERTQKRRGPINPPPNFPPSESVKQSKQRESVSKAEEPVAPKAQSPSATKSTPAESTPEQKATLTGTPEPPKPRLFIDGFTPSALGDQPSKQDHLGREKLARVLAAMFASKAQGTPFTVAILGEWGSGKSTLMELIKKELKPDPKAIDQTGSKRNFDIAEFNAWEYEHTDNIRAGLAQEVVKGLTSDLKGWDRRWFVWKYARVEHRSDLMRILAGLILVILATLVAGGLAYWWLENPIAKDLVKTGAVAGVVTFLVTAWKNLKTIFDHPLSTELTTYLKLPSYGEHLGQVPVIKRQLKSLCELRLETSEDGKTEKRRLIVFVDDLDRCSPKCITDTLDAIRLVMNIPSVIVVIMIDHRIAMKAVARQYASLADERHDQYAIARDYLGKIIQVPITLMPAAPERMDEFIDKALFPSAKSKYHLDDKPKETEAKPVQPKPDALDVPAPQPAGQVTPATPASPSTPGAAVASSAPSASTRTPAQVVKEQKRIEEEMQDTVDDREFFQRLVKSFGFNNPRQLLRMRNSFRVLKGITRGNTDQPVTPERARQMMLALFWLELINDRTAVERARLQSEVMNGELKAGTISGEFKTFFIEVFGKDVFAKDRASLDDFLSFVARFVLPYHDGNESPLNPQAEK